MLRIKPGASVKGLQPQALIALYIAEQVYGSYGADCWLTSGTDGKHGAESLHYSGLAVDIRISNLEDAIPTKEAREKIANALSVEYDVVLEPDHIHIEYDPD